MRIIYKQVVKDRGVKFLIPTWVMLLVDLNVSGIKAEYNSDLEYLKLYLPDHKRLYLWNGEKGVVRLLVKGFRKELLMNVTPKEAMYIVNFLARLLS